MSDTAEPGVMAVDVLRQRLGVKTHEPDQQLARCWDAAQAWVAARVYDGCDEPDVYEATLLLAQRLYSRRQTPEGVAGWGDLGVIRILTTDPDIEQLLERHVDSCKAGIA